MKNMLILTDFSEEAFRAAEYGCELASCLGIKRIILYHAYQPVMAYAVTPGAPVVNTDDQQMHLESMEGLGLLQDRLRPMLEKNFAIDLIAEDSALAGVAGLIKERTGSEAIDLIVMGVSGKSGLDKFLLGSTTTQLLEENKWPVLIVPGNTVLGKGIKTIALTCDLEEVDALPVQKLYEFLDALPAKLQVMNVAPEKKDEYSPEIKAAIAGLHKLLEKYDPSFNYVDGSDIPEEILRFADGQQASLIITIHQQHGLLSNLFHKSVTKKLAYNSRVPLLSLPALKTT
jgi:nucleotide-binding universal stress UspA family protein